MPVRLDDGLDDKGGEVVGADGGEGAAVPADGGAEGGDDGGSAWHAGS